MSGLGLAIRVRQGVIQSAIDNSWRRFRRWNAVILVDRLLRFNLGALDPLDDAVDSLMTILLRGSVLLMFLQVRATAHRSTQAWTAGPRRRLNICHVWDSFGSF